MKKRILEMLQESSQPLSGQEISRTLGVSKIAVWQHIVRLKQSGHEIESTAKGYRLVTIPDTPFPWLFGPRSSLIHYHPELDSTMDRALDLARAGCPPSTVVIADRQLEGRGRMQRRWDSENGGLYFSMVLRPSLPPRMCPVINLAVALDLVKTMSHCCGITAQVKWPNDVLVDERKIAGILSQMEIEADQVAFVNVGIGINLNNQLKVIDKSAVSALQLTGRRVDRVEVLVDFLGRFEARLAAFSSRDVLQEWRERTVTLGRTVAIVTVRDSYEGLAIDIDDEGGLIIEMADGTRHTVFYGDCFHS